MQKKPKLFDAHAHVQFQAFKDDAEVVLERALAEEIWVVNVGSQKSTSERAVSFAEKYEEGVYASVGLHPIHTEESFHDEEELGSIKGNEFTESFASKTEVFEYNTYKQLASRGKTVAIGECGFDYYRLSENSKGLQASAFEGQIVLAHELKKPLMIHCRNAYDDLVSFLEARKNTLNSPPGIIHFFSSNRKRAERLLDLGFYFTFGGVITFARDYDKVLEFIPIDRILIETDAPYVAPEPHRGERNEPSFVVETAKKLAEIKKLPFEEVCWKTTENAFSVFRLEE